MKKDDKEKTYKMYSGQEPWPRSKVKAMIDSYNDGVRNNKFQRYMHVVKAIPSKIGLVLDYGCGWGCISRAIAEKENRVIGIDAFEGALEVARDFNSHPGVQYLSRRIDAFDEEMFDLVNSNQVLEHVHNPGTYLTNANRVLKKNGCLVISVPNVVNLRILARQVRRKDHSQNFRRLSEQMLETYDKGSNHIHSWTPWEFITLLASVGFIYEQHSFVEGVFMPWGKARHSRVPWGGRYYHSMNKRLNNLSYTMLFRFRKVGCADIRPED